MYDLFSAPFKDINDIDLLLHLSMVDYHVRYEEEDSAILEELADYLLYTLMNAKGKETIELRHECIALIRCIRSCVLKNDFKFNLIIEIIGWHTYMSNEPDSQYIQLMAQTALMTIE